ncbi:MAG: long-chain fatty acid--CoA ligase [Ignavibacteria bacterium]|nr:long-chain fatty acid--CoA ligase [Ignavibacteria bacterium]
MKKTLTELLLTSLTKEGINEEIFYTKIENKYTSFGFKELVLSINYLIKFFKDSVLQEGDKVAIVSESRIEWVAVDFACMFFKLVSVPIYPSSSDQQIKYILENSDSCICFISNYLLLDKIIKIKSNDSEKIKLVVFNDFDNSNYKEGLIIKYTEIFTDKAVNDLNENIFAEIIKRLKIMSADIYENDLLTIIYTSGTTGLPKGVMLTHLNIYSNVISCQKVLPIDNTDIFLSYLPYSHIYERTAGYYLPLFCGAKIYYAQNIDTISIQLMEVKPTFVITVPRLLDKIYNRLIKSGEEMETGFKKKLFNWSIQIANKKNYSKNSLKWKIADKLVYKKIREKTGGKIRYFVSGGGALNKKIGEFFYNLNIVVLEGYGMTETSPVISVNHPEHFKFGTVGKIVDGVELKFSAENEILVKGELVMQGYYKDEVATNETIINNWIHTGDIGEFDDEGYLKITDRKKSIMKTSGGKYIAPAIIEEIISTLSYIENIIIIGDERMYVTALIVPDKNELQDFAKKNKINFDSYTELLKDSTLQKLINNDINKLQNGLSGFEKIRKFTLIPEPFSVESGELTPTLKVKRKFVAEKYKDEIESMYFKI